MKFMAQILTLLFSILLLGCTPTDTLTLNVSKGLVETSKNGLIAYFESQERDKIYASHLYLDDRIVVTLPEFTLQKSGRFYYALQEVRSKDTTKVTPRYYREQIGNYFQNLLKGHLRDFEYQVSLGAKILLVVQGKDNKLSRSSDN